MRIGQSTYLIYDKIASLYDKAFSVPSKYLKKFRLVLPPHGKVLDVGCGTGIDCGYIAQKGHTVTGIDLSTGMLNIARQHFPDLQFVKKDLTKLTYKPESFDGIIASFSLIHITKKQTPKTLKKRYDMIKKNGVIYIGLQGGKSRETHVPEPFKPDEMLFLNIFSYKEIVDLLRHIGFKIIMKKYETGKAPKGELAFGKIYIIARK